MATVFALRRWAYRNCLLHENESFTVLRETSRTAHPKHQQQPSRQWLSISRMLDMGGAPSSMTEKNVARTVNASKNCTLQAIVFDLATLTRSIGDTTTAPEIELKSEDRSDPKIRASIMPDASKVQSIANILNVSLGDSTSSGGAGSVPRRGRSDQDDLSLLTGKVATSTSTAPPPPPASTAGGDIRAKYASKLSSKGMGSIASVELARHQAEESMKRGDAGGHWAARKLVGAPTAAATTSTGAPGGGGGTKWMARTGTGRLLQYLTRRSIRIALVPSQPNLPSTTSEGSDMSALQRQLQDVVFDALVLPNHPDVAATADSILSRAFTLLGQNDGMVAIPSAALLVSSREDYLRAAKERGWMTCRVRPKNAPRGNVSTTFMVESVPDVRQVVDEINGISYSAVLNGR